jgi:hypothetical protein
MNKIAVKTSEEKRADGVFYCVEGVPGETIWDKV